MTFAGLAHAERWKIAAEAFDVLDRQLPHALAFKSLPAASSYFNVGRNNNNEADATDRVPWSIFPAGVGFDGPYLTSEEADECGRFVPLDPMEPDFFLNVPYGIIEQCSEIERLLNRVGSLFTGFNCGENRRRVTGSGPKQLWLNYLFLGGTIIYGPTCASIKHLFSQCRMAASDIADAIFEEVQTGVRPELIAVSPPSGIRLMVTRQQIADFIAHRSTKTVSRYSPAWGQPDIRGGGSVADKFDLERIRPILKIQFPDAKTADWAALERVCVS